MKYDVVAPYKEDILEEEIIHGPKLLLKYFYIDENEQKTVFAFFLIIQIQKYFLWNKRLT